MISFLSGAAIAIVLSVVTWIGLTTFSQTEIERYHTQALQMDDVDPTYETGETSD